MNPQRRIEAGNNFRRHTNPRLCRRHGPAMGPDVKVKTSSASLYQSFSSVPCVNGLFTKETALFADGPLT
ncbi:hypothetical protein POI8812_00205 [Pontivivens insulae]|uniref:Uncharacterized protein n=1 Tax=Pontivivens insulae TaxID=1639689 RepID=A0A2R8A7C0_9RHOB|nr:hypothetical protein DFR53_0206 [Pontivivens insulae]SPF27910.1 hypothetical protein POI8812_00205 [Pontivivens insulae]